MRSFLLLCTAAIGLMSAQPAFAETYDEAAQCILDNADAATKVFIGGIARKTSDTGSDTPIAKSAAAAAYLCEEKFGWQGKQASNAMTLASYAYNRDVELAKLRRSGANPAVIKDVPALVALVMRLGNGEPAAEAEAAGWLKRHGYATLDDFIASPFFGYFQDMLSIAVTKQQFGAAWQ